ncbi:hypothetical protein V6N13_003173 [Hibiscus sabdariffa]
MWRRTQFLLDVLQRGYNFIFTDIDIIWLNNPFTWLSPLESEDLEISVDPRPEHNCINTGFYYIRSNNKTISMFKTWYSKKDNSTGMEEQAVLQELIRCGLLQQLDLKVRFLDTRDLSTALRDWKQFKAAIAQHPELGAKIAEDFKWSAHTDCLNSWQ